MNKRKARLRRAGRGRARIRRLGLERLSVHKTPRHIYAQLFSPCGTKVLVSASTLDRELRENIAYGGNIEAASLVGSLLGKRAKEAGITRVAFDRSGFKYHGRIKALADSAREQGMEF